LFERSDGKIGRQKSGEEEMYYICSEYIKLEMSELVHPVSPTLTYLRKCGRVMSKLRFGKLMVRGRYPRFWELSDHDSTLHLMLGTLPTRNPSSSFTFILDMNIKDIAFKDVSICYSYTV
jgi:hypothetical protein